VPLSSDALVGRLTLAEKQQVELARILQQQSQIIILDEPNSALNETESRRLFDMIRRLRERGIYFHLRFASVGGSVRHCRAHHRLA
jgi:ABC-type sugar transport system ATPase subunit